MKIGIVCPVYVTSGQHKLCIDYATASLRSELHELVLLPVENYIAPAFPVLEYQLSQPIECIRLVGRQPQSVCRAWNDGIDKAVEIRCDYILVINEDVVLKHNAIDRIVEFAQVHAEAIFWSLGQYADLITLQQATDGEDYSEHPLFEAYLLSAAFFGTVGRFDENFAPAYMEDNDMHARIVLSGNIAYSYGGALFYHFGSMTIRADDQVHAHVDRSWNANCDYFYRKWGHAIVSDPAEMRQLYYQHPYNDLTKPLSYWELG